MVSGHQEPAFTVASLATTTTSRPSTTPDAGDHAGAGRLAVVLVVGHQQAELEPGRARDRAAARPARAGASLPCWCILATRAGAAALPAGAAASCAVLLGERAQAAAAGLMTRGARTPTTRCSR